MNVPLSQRLAGRAQVTPLRVLCAVVVSLCAVATVSAQEPLSKAKALYDAARYEEALTIYQAVGDDVQDVSPVADEDRLRDALALCRNAWTYPDQAS